MRPVILTGINTVATSQDLINRQILVELQDFNSEDEREDESVIWQRFEKARPRILGALLMGVSVALRHINDLEIHRLPRMADFAKWGTAAEVAWEWPAGSFLEAYAEDQANQAAASVEADLVASTLVEFMQDRDCWEGTPTELHEALMEIVPEGKRNLRVGKTYAFPRVANVLTRRIRKAQVFLKQFGLKIIDGHTGDRAIRIDRQGGRKTVQIVQTVQKQESCGFSADDISGETVQDGRNTVQPPSEDPGLDDTSSGLDDMDGMDGKKQDLSKTDEDELSLEEVSL
jgi:hypothetical protein